MKKFKKTYSKGTQPDQLQSLVMAVQDGCVDSFNEVAAFPLLGGVLIENLRITTTPSKIDHGLGAVPRGLVVVKNVLTDSSTGQLPMWDTSRSFLDRSMWLRVFEGEWSGSLWIWK